MSATDSDPLYAARVKAEVARRLFGGDASPLRVGRFEVGERLGAGAMSVVYAARDPELGRQVALKLLQDDVRDERLLREARALARLRHPHVVAVYEVGRWNEHLFVALEHVEGATLGAWLRAAPRTWREVVRVMRDVADGLAAVHGLGLVHRDVKPDNIVVDASGSARLVDFGLVTDAEARAAEDGEAVAPTAAPADAESTVTRPGATPGTPHFLAPERRAGGPATPASDQFSFGLTLEEALEGRDAPARVRAVASRARAEREAERFPDLRAVHDALGREPRTLRAAIVTLGLVALGAAAVVAWTRASRDPCEDGARIAAEHWSAAARSAVHDAAAASALDAYAHDWASAYRDVCRAGPGTPAASRTERAACLDGRLAALDDAVGALRRGAVADDVVGALPPLSDCRPEETPTDPAADPSLYVELAQGTASAAARAAQRTGLRAFRDGDNETASVSFGQAARLDAQYGAPKLWHALLMSHGDVSAARVDFRAAYALRGGMGAANRTLLHALVPCIQSDPPDDVECEARLARAAEASPRSAHLWFELARHRWNREGSSPAVIAAFDRALRADPAFGLARFSRGQALAYLGRFDEAVATTEECTRLVPGALACLHGSVWLHAERGECALVERDARRWRAAAPADPLPYTFLAAAASSRAEPPAAVGELLEEAAARSPEPAFFRARDRALSSIAAGDFEAARGDLDALDVAVAGSTDRALRLLAPRLRIEVALETGDRDEAGRLADDALARMRAWTPDPRTEDFGIARDAEPELLDVLRETGRIDDATRDARRDAWLSAWRARTAHANYPFLWLAAFGRTVDDAHEAADALAAATEYGRPPYHPLAFADAGVGRMLLFAGRPAEAVPLLRRAAETCHAPEFEFGAELPWASVRAFRDLGRALEATGDTAGACDAYAHVLARWGEARPRSVTAADARARRAALRCVP